MLRWLIFGFLFRGSVLSYPRLCRESAKKAKLELALSRPKGKFGSVLFDIFQAFSANV
jgi:hypothetical protein